MKHVAVVDVLYLREAKNQLLSCRNDDFIVLFGLSTSSRQCCGQPDIVVFNLCPVSNIYGCIDSPGEFSRERRW